MSCVWGHGLIGVLSVERRGPFTQFSSTVGIQESFLVLGTSVNPLHDSSAPCFSGGFICKTLTQRLSVSSVDSCPASLGFLHQGYMCPPWLTSAGEVRRDSKSLSFLQHKAFVHTVHKSDLVFKSNLIRPYCHFVSDKIWSVCSDRVVNICCIAICLLQFVSVSTNLRDFHLKWLRMTVSVKGEDIKLEIVPLLHDVHHESTNSQGTSENIHVSSRSVLCISCAWNCWLYCSFTIHYIMNVTQFDTWWNSEQKWVCLNFKSAYFVFCYMHAMYWIRKKLLDTWSDHWDWNIWNQIAKNF